MAKTIQTAIEAGSRMAPAKFYIKITPDGPYLLYVILLWIKRL